MIAAVFQSRFAGGGGDAAVGEREVVMPGTARQQADAEGEG